MQPDNYSSTVDDYMDFFFGANGCVTTGFVCRDDIVLVDNCQTHQSALPLLRHMLFASGIGLILLPPYRPEFNPIEFMWSKVKYLIRRYGKATKGQYLGSLTRTTAICDVFISHLFWYRSYNWHINRLVFSSLLCARPQ